MAKYLVTNFAYGTGPYLRTTELALDFNKELEKRDKERLGIIVPRVYGDKQNMIMMEEFSPFADEIFLDEGLGALLKSIFYGDNTYEEALRKWIEGAKEMSKKANGYLSNKFSVTSLSGKQIEVNGEDIVAEINRAPRLRYDIAPVYYTSFGHISQILENSKKIPYETISVDPELLERGVKISEWVESAGKIHVIAYPATFSWRDDYKLKYPTEVLTPPIARLYEPNHEEFEPGIFVTITGIPGLERLYEDTRRLGLKLYSNDTEAVPGSIKKLPHVIPNKNTVFNFARAGFGSIWPSMTSGTPIVVPDFDPKDDPEVYFNNVLLEELGIGFVYRGEPLEEILKEIPRLKENSKNMCAKILARWGTLDGNQYCAKLFADDFLKGA